ncbi:MAG: hypothetical protein V7676_02345 [Parasphingorhabdus sp.]|uniref:hypothetical protein n=1 Tax=Parasphingorhabdus sp. TaxID=2709688 RepID=UPI003002AE9F
MLSYFIALAIAGELSGSSADKEPIKEDKIVCRSVMTVGSRIPDRVCRTKKEWANIARENEEQLQNRSNYSRGTQNRNTE